MMNITLTGMLHPKAIACRQDGLIRFVDGVAHLHHGGLDRAAVRAKIVRLKDWLMTLPNPREFAVEHEQCDGMYVRKLHIPKGSILVGKVHKKPCINFVESGDIEVLTEFGVKRLQPGWMAQSQAGIQKVGITHENTVFVNVFRTDECDLAQIEHEIASEEALCL